MGGGDKPLRNLAGVRLVWARSPADLDGADWIVLPGSKHSRADLAWLRERRLDAAIARHAGRLTFRVPSSWVPTLLNRK